ncbi:MAG TPA: hypothetical protein VJ953_18415 [Saprospiraceae bacterium]|nr:hypothetical protein [Saprospiraceae bacterium]
MTNQEYFAEYQAAVKGIMQMAKEIDVEDDHAHLKIEKIKVLEKLVKQGNNTYKNALAYDIARAKFEQYDDSFLDEDTPKLPGAEE